MRQSNVYVLVFSAIMTIICGGLLALASTGLEPMQKKQIELDTQKQILSAVLEITPEMDVASIYNKRINSYVVDSKGDKIEGEVAEKVNTKKVYKEKNSDAKKFPVFEFKSESGELEAYIIPTYGKGLWDDVWGYIALEKDLKTIKGVSLGHKAETPGLGARITDSEIQKRFVGKKICCDTDGTSVHFIKGESVKTSFTDYEVDGLSGATMTTKGVNAMIKNYYSNYENYFKKLSNK